MKLDLYEIRYCKKEEYDKLRNFFYYYWKKNHILCKSKEIFEFQHGTAPNGYYDFVVAVHKETGEFHAVLGFIRSSLYDGLEYNEPQVIYGALWKVRNDVENKEIRKVGLGVLYYLLEKFPNSTYITLGLSKYSQIIYEALHFNYGTLKHYYIANRHKDRFRIIKNPILKAEKKINRNIEIKLVNVNKSDIQNSFYPNKNTEYIKRRYLNHPTYKYDVLGIYKNGQLICEWIIRKICVKQSNCVRIIDMLGTLDGLGDFEENVIEFLNQNKAEYIDCYNYGIELQKFSEIGFREVIGETIVPNYFEPFEQKNIDIHFAYNNEQPAVIFKGDGDQDRPSLI